MLKPKIVIVLAGLACVACTRDVTSPHEEGAAIGQVRRDGGGTLGSGYRTPADSTESGSVTSAGLSGGTSGSGSAAAAGDNGTLGSGY
jgi:hypothetical protein